MPTCTDTDRLVKVVERGMVGFPLRRRCLVAISGGRDSVTLLDLLLRSGRKNLVLVHVNHQLRGRASGADAAFVRRLAAKHGLPVMIGKADTRAYAKARGASIELAARELRMSVFSAAAARYRATHLVMAHHADDQMETCLFNYLRGSGLTGLAGMRQESTFDAGTCRLTIHRPMLTIWRSEIDAHIQRERLRHREDASNAAPDFTRNRIRHELMPLVVDIMGDRAISAILRNAEILREEDAYFQQLVTTRPLEKEFSVHLLRPIPRALQRRMVHAWLKRFGPAECGFAEVEGVLSLVPEDASVSKVNLPEGVHVRRTAGRIFLQPPIP